MAPSVAASLTAAPRLISEELLASTSRRQLGHTAETMSRSREISCAQPPLARGYFVPPLWLTLRKQPFTVVHGANPYWLR